MLATEHFAWVVEKAEKTFKSNSWKEEFYMKDNAIGTLNWVITNGIGQQVAGPEFFLGLVRKSGPGRSWPMVETVFGELIMWFGDDKSTMKKISGSWDLGGIEKGYGNTLNGHFTWADVSNCMQKQALVVHLDLNITRVIMETNSSAYHAGILQDDLQNLRQTSTGDVEIIFNKTGIGAIQAHSLILKARSEYFRKMLQEDRFKEGKTGIIDFSSYTKEEAELVPLVIRYLYNADVAVFAKLELQECIVVYKLADMYQVKPLTELMVHRMGKLLPTASRHAISMVLPLVPTMDPVLQGSIKNALCNRFDDIWALTVLHQ